MHIKIEEMSLSMRGQIQISTTNGFEVSLVAMKSNTNKSNWYFDLGAIHQVTISKGKICQFIELGDKVKVKVVGGEDHIVKGNGLALLHLQHGEIKTIILDMCQV